jgi:uncharacterized repeat protein (TIGR04138 family)
MDQDWTQLGITFDRYPPEAYDFVQRGLTHTVARIHGEQADDLGQIPDPSRHVSGQQLCLGLRQYAIDQYGRLARTVLNRWGIRRTEDFGRIVFDMIDAGLLRKTEDDSIKDFLNIYDFHEAFSISDHN